MWKILIIGCLSTILGGCAGVTSVADAVVGDALSSPLVSTEFDTDIVSGDKTESLTIKAGGEENSIQTDSYKEITNIVNQVPTDILLGGVLLIVLGWMSPTPSVIRKSLVDGFVASLMFILDIVKNTLLFFPNFILRLLGRETF